MTSKRRQIASKKRNEQIDSGSPSTIGEPEFLLIGKMGRPHGINGEILLYVMTDFPERIEVGKTFYIGDQHQPHVLKNHRHHNKGLIIKFSEYRHRDQVDVLKNKGIFVRSDEIPPLDDGQYYLHQLIGLRVISDTGAEIGQLISHIETGANNVYIIRPKEGKEILIPAIDEVILSVDLVAKEMKVHLPEGLMDLYQ